MIEWHWVILIIMGSGWLGAIIRGLFMNRRSKGIVRIDIIEDRRAEKTIVEVGENQFAFPDNLGNQLADVLYDFAIELRHRPTGHRPIRVKSVREIGDMPTDLKRVQWLEIE